MIAHLILSELSLNTYIDAKLHVIWCHFPFSGVCYSSPLMSNFLIFESILQALDQEKSRTEFSNSLCSERNSLGLTPYNELKQKKNLKAVSLNHTLCNANSNKANLIGRAMKDRNILKDHHGVGATHIKLILDQIRILLKHLETLVLGMNSALDCI